MFSISEKDAKGVHLRFSLLPFRNRNRNRKNLRCAHAKVDPAFAIDSLGRVVKVSLVAETSCRQTLTYLHRARTCLTEE